MDAYKAGPVTGHGTGRRFFAMLFLGGLALCGAPFLSGCAVMNDMHTALFDTRSVNLTDSSYAAADMLAQQAQARMTHHTPLRIAMLTDVTTPYEVTAFGQQVANLLGSRFVQLGYNVQSVPLPPALMPELSGGPAPVPANSPQPVQTGITPTAGKGDVMVTGTYIRNKNTIEISLKMLQGRSQTVIAAYDYTLPMTRDLRQTSMSEADRIRSSAASQPSGIYAD